MLHKTSNNGSKRAETTPFGKDKEYSVAGAEGEAAHEDDQANVAAKKRRRKDTLGMREQ